MGADAIPRSRYGRAARTRARDRPASFFSCHGATQLPTPTEPPPNVDVTSARRTAQQHRRQPSARPRLPGLIWPAPRGVVRCTPAVQHAPDARPRHQVPVDPRVVRNRYAVAPLEPCHPRRPAAPMRYRRSLGAVGNREISTDMGVCIMNKRVDTRLSRAGVYSNMLR